jgi:hypothetical protein
MKKNKRPLTEGTMKGGKKPIGGGRSPLCGPPPPMIKDGYKEAYEKLLTQWKHLNCKVNKVTAYYRHSIKVPDKAMTELCNTQLDAEDRIEQIEGSVFTNQIINE